MPPQPEVTTIRSKATSHLAYRLFPTVTRGIATLNGESLLQEGDGVQVNSPELLELSIESNAKILLFDLS